MDHGVWPIYINRILNVLSRLSPPFCYIPLVAIGHKFRDWRSYSGSGIEPGVLYRAMDTVEHCLGIDQKTARTLINSYLRFESRYLLENYWMIRSDYSKIKRAFSPKARSEYFKYLERGQQIIVVIHTANLLLMASLAQVYVFDTCAMVSEIPNTISTKGNPIHNHAVRMVYYWKKWQPLIPPSAKKAIEIIKKGHSIFIAADLPGFNDRGIKVRFLGSNIWVPTGAVKLANRFDIPLLIAVSWAGTCIEKYNIAFKNIAPSGDIETDLQKIFETVEKFVLINPSCWMGWLYLHNMVAK